MSSFHDANNTFSMTTAPPTAPPSPPVPPDPTRALPSLPPFIPIGQKKYTPRSIFLPRGVCLWPGFGNCLCAAVVGCLVDLIMGYLFEGQEILFCIPLGGGSWKLLAEKHFLSHDTFLFCAGIPFFKGNVRSSSHWDCRPLSCRRKTTLPSHFSASTSLTMSPLTVFHTGTAHKTVFPFPHKEFCWFMCYSGTFPSPPLPSSSTHQICTLKST